MNSNKGKKIFDTKETLAQVLDKLEVHPLLATVAEVTSNYNILLEEFAPKVSHMTAAVPRNGGLDDIVAGRAREQAVDALWDWMSAKGRDLENRRDLRDLGKILTFLVGSEAREYLPLLEQELGDPEICADPGWRLSEDKKQNFTVGVIGAGISGLAIAYRLKKAGISFRVFEKNPDVGGTWWENTYPGCRLDTPNFAYTYRFARSVNWPDLFSQQNEILNYLKETANKEELVKHCAFNTKVLQAKWLDDESKWEVIVSGPEGVKKERFRYLVSAVGILNQPKFPDIPGRSLFKGEAVHSARWTNDIDLSGKRCAIIGTGASAYQIAPSIASTVSSLTVYQRHAPWMLPTPNYLEPVPESMKMIIEAIPRYGDWYRFWQFWLSVEGRLYVARVDPDWRVPGSVSMANEEFKGELIEYYKDQYRNMPEKLNQVIPNYAPGAKRLLRDNGQWARMLERENVYLETRAIREINEEGIITIDGEEQNYDVIIYATGFRSGDMLGSFELIGRDGISLKEFWGGNARSYGGTMIPGFPNFGMILGPNQAVLINGSIPFMSECASDYIMAVLKMLVESDKNSIECTPDAYWKFNKEMDEENALMVWGVSDVPTWYKNEFNRTISTWPKSQLDFWLRTRGVNGADVKLI